MRGYPADPSRPPDEYFSSDSSRNIEVDNGAAGAAHRAARQTARDEAVSRGPLTKYDMNITNRYNFPDV